MRIKNVVKVMNFHSLLRVDASKRQAESYRNVGEEITKIIKSIVYNKNLVLDKKVILSDPKMARLNIYIANDYGFCGNFNSQIARQIKEDINDYKIIIGKKIIYTDDKTILKINKDDFYKEFNKIEKTVDDAIRNSTYSEINLYYNHYNSSTSFEFRKLTLFPIDFDGEYDEKNDFVIETDIRAEPLKNTYEPFFDRCRARWSSVVLAHHDTQIFKYIVRQHACLAAARRAAFSSAPVEPYAAYGGVFCA